MTLSVGSLCSGYEGLGLGLARVLDTETAWVSEVDPDACKVLEARLPGVPNVGDLTVLDWSTVPPVDVLTAGYPCQPFSTAGRRKGTSDVRHLWPFIADAIGVLRPGLVCLENVSGHLSLGFDTVLADLARLGYDARWCVVRASDIGACHRRARLFVAAYPPLTERGEPQFQGLDPPCRSTAEPRERSSSCGDAPDADHRTDDWKRSRSELGQGSEAAPDANCVGWDGWSRTAGRDEGRRTAPSWTGEDTPADPSHIGLQWDGGARNGRTGPASAGCLTPAHPDNFGCQRTVAQSWGHNGRSDWGAYGPAIARHAAALGRPAPDPVDGRGRLNPGFVEWMMMLGAGWVTDVPRLSRAKMLKILGNGVVPAQAAFAYRRLLEAL